MKQLHVLITGTTSGIGCGLLEHYAGNNFHVTALNRRTDETGKLRWPGVRFVTVDVRDTAGVAQLIHALAQENDLPDIFVLNAGINRVDNDTHLDLVQFRDTMDTNLYGAINFAAPLTELKSWPHPIKIVAISSTTNYGANPYCLGYYISKIALTRCFQILSDMYSSTPLRFKWVILGPVPTAINSSGDKFPKIMIIIKNLFSATLENAVHTISKFALNNRHQLIYPWKAYFLFRAMGIARLLIPGFYQGQKTLSGEPRHCSK